MNKFKALFVPYYKRFRFIQYFIKDKSKISLARRFWCLGKGFFPRNYILYDLKSADYRKYVSDYAEYAKMSGINKSTNYINNKLIFTELIKTFVEMPEILGVFEEGRWVRYGKDGLNDLDALIHKITKKKEGVILKPISGDGGIGIAKIEFTDRFYQWNQEELDLEMVLKRLEKLNGYYVSNLVQQHQYATEIYPSSINTLRLLTMIDPVTNQAFIAAASHRIGNDRSYPVDNCAKGGFTASIDLESGTLAKAVRTYFKGNVPNYYAEHPDSKRPIEGVKVPHWELIKDKTLKMAESFQFAPYIAWDIVLKPNEEITVLEANDGADLKLHQVHEPLLKSDIVKRFYSFHKVI